MTDQIRNALLALLLIALYGLTIVYPDKGFINVASTCLIAWSLARILSAFLQLNEVLHLNEGGGARRERAAKETSELLKVVASQGAFLTAFSWLRAVALITVSAYVGSTVGPVLFIVSIVMIQVAIKASKQGMDTYHTEQSRASADSKPTPINGGPIDNSLRDYLVSDINRGAIDHVIRSHITDSGHVRFYIRPMAASGMTSDFLLDGDRIHAVVSPLTRKAAA